MGDALKPRAPQVYKPNPQKILPPRVYSASRPTGTTTTQPKLAGNLQTETRPAPVPYRPAQEQAGVQAKSGSKFHTETRSAPPAYRPGLPSTAPETVGRSIQQKTKSSGGTRRIKQFLPIQRAQAAAAAARPPAVVNVQYSAALHKEALLAANVQAVSTFFHANEAGILPKGKQSRVWSPYIEFNLARKYDLGARAVFDVVDQKIFLAGHYDDGGDYELLTDVPAEVTASLTGKALTELKNLCIGTKLESVAKWTTADNMGLLIRSMAGNFQMHGNPLGKA
jgi:hypothetical protein